LNFSTSFATSALIVFARAGQPVPGVLILANLANPGEDVVRLKRANRINL